MHSDITVLIIEEDFYARNWIALLLARDWRTTSVCDVANIAEAVHFLSKNPEQIDFILLDADLACSKDLVQLQASINNRHKTKILIVGDMINEKILKASISDRFMGCIIKSEIKYSLAWAVVFAFDGKWVMTPMVCEAAIKWGILLPKNQLTLDGRRTINNLSDHEIEVARLALIFSMERRDMSDELNIANDWAYGLVSELYKKLGLEDVLEGGKDQKTYLGNHPAILDHVQSIIDRLNGSKKAKDMETLAFHLITTPEIVD